jgi:hypothetical protein
VRFVPILGVEVSYDVLDFNHFTPVSAGRTVLWLNSAFGPLGESLLLLDWVQTFAYSSARLCHAYDQMARPCMV